MLLGGIQKLTTLDFPGLVSCTVFTRGCNFSCPYCHNPDLVRPAPAGRGQAESAEAPLLENTEFFAFLRKRQGLLE
ncbi:4Fe-4S cluster-binding domain-containing protein, partial [Desulfovibrio sp. OttesenSCG-928-C14]|nr:4Fe-4S cluster-binding domain-containing protein [Desulfovibrio sp. OttesenSCG-928-C14]